MKVFRSLRSSFGGRTPVVATGVDGTSEIAADGKTGLTVRAGDPVALAASIFLDATSRSWRKRWAMPDASSFSNTFSRERQVQQTEEAHRYAWALQPRSPQCSPVRRNGWRHAQRSIDEGGWVSVLHPLFRRATTRGLPIRLPSFQLCSSRWPACGGAYRQSCARRGNLAPRWLARSLVGDVDFLCVFDDHAALPTTDRVGRRADVGGTGTPGRGWY